MRKTVILGLTGPTGAGKSTVAELLRQQGCRVIDCDRVARSVAETSKPCRDALQAAFGADIIRADGTLNRGLLAARAFSSPENTALLNGITHPWILREMRELLAHAQKEAQVVVVDAPLLYEAGADALCDRVLAVVAPAPVRLGRIMRRDGIDEASARLRMRSQKDDTYYTSRADDCIDGSMPLSDMRRVVPAVLERITGEML